MLVSFDVENWTCFRDRQWFDMEATKGLPDEFAFDTKVSVYPRLTRAALIYGPNGTGKSCFVDALEFAKQLVLFSVQQTHQGKPIAAQPFLYDTATRMKPSSFKIVFIENEVVYDYSFAVDTKRVLEERLYVRRPGGRRQNWLSREYRSASGTFIWKFGSGLRGSRSIWRKATREDALFVSTAVQLNSESLHPVMNWFRTLVVIGSGGISPSLTSKSVKDDPEFKDRLVRFLGQMDIRLSEVRVREKDSVQGDIGSLPPVKRLEDFGSRLNAKGLVPEFGLPVKGGDRLAFLELDKQSDGIQRIYALASPWLEVVERGGVVVVDELDRSLHPHLVQFLIRYINDSHPPNRHRAQLVATVQDTLLLESAVDRRQVWLTEKIQDQTARLTPLFSYKPRKNESLRRGYLGGRYGAIPNVADSPVIG